MKKGNHELPGDTHVSVFSAGNDHRAFRSTVAQRSDHMAQILHTVEKLQVGRVKYFIQICEWSLRE